MKPRNSPLIRTLAFLLIPLLLFGSSIQVLIQLNGDVTGPQNNTTVAKINHTTVPTNAAADQTLVTTSASNAAWKSIPNCPDGSHLNYATSTHAFSCGSIVINTPVSLTDNGSTIATDASLANNFRVTALTANVTLSNPTNASNGQSITWEIIQNASAAKTLAFDTQFGFGAEITACTISATLSSHDFITAVFNSTTTKWYVRGCITGY